MSTVKRPGRPPKYDWDLWTDGQPHVKYQGKDFSSDLASFRALVHSTAARRGLKVATNIDKAQKSVSFTFRNDD